MSIASTTTAFWALPAHFARAHEADRRDVVAGGAQGGENRRIGDLEAGIRPSNRDERGQERGARDGALWRMLPQSPHCADRSSAARDYAERASEHRTCRDDLSSSTMTMSPLFGTPESFEVIAQSPPEALGGVESVVCVPDVQAARHAEGRRCARWRPSRRAKISR